MMAMMTKPGLSFIFRCHKSQKQRAMTYHHLDMMIMTMIAIMAIGT